MLEIHHVNVCYQDQPIFAPGFSFSVPTGQWFALMGKSGVGKTSLLRWMAGLEGPRLMEVAYMAQEDGLFPWLSVLDNVLLPFHLSGKTPDLNEAKSLLKAVGLEDYQSRRPKSLSGGMRQRVALARTLIQHQPIVLMDEPFSALDAITRMEMQALSFELLRKAKKTVVMVTHDPWEALRLADSILILAGTPAIIKKRITLPKAEALRDVTDPKVIQHYQELLAFF